MYSWFPGPNRDKKKKKKRRKCIYIAKPVKKTLTLNKSCLFHKNTVSASHWYSYSTKNNFLVLVLSISFFFLWRILILMASYRTAQLLGSFTWLPMGLLWFFQQPRDSSTLLKSVESLLKCHLKDAFTCSTFLSHDS